jgi:ADP-heptose:LPS heptosyltransferase
MASYANYSLKARAIARLIDSITWPFGIFRKKQKPEKIEKILLVRPDHLGDLLMNIDAMYSLKKTFPHSRIFLVTPDWNQPIAQKLEFIDEIIPINLKWYCFNREPHTHLIELIKKIWALRKIKIDLFIDFRGDFRIALLFGFFSGSKIRRGFSNLGGRYLLNNHTVFNRKIHFLQQNFELIAPFTESRYHYKIPLDKSDELKAEELLLHYGLKPGSFVIMHPTVAGYWSLKRWPLNHFIEVAQHIISNHHLQIIICSGPAERETGNSLARSVPESINLSGCLTIIEFIALLKQAFFLISNDSAPMHLAVQILTPLIAVFGPTNYRRSGPYPLNECQIAVEGDIGLKRPLFGVQSLGKGYFPKPETVLGKIDELIKYLENQK